MLKHVAKILFLIIALLFLTGCKNKTPETWIDALPDKNDASNTFFIPIIVQIDRPDSSQLSDEHLKKLATNYRAISSRETEFSVKQTNRMKEINPDLIILKYMNFASGYRVVDDNYRKSHPETVLYTPAGEPCRDLLGDGDNSIVMDPSNEVWRQTLVDSALNAVTSEGFDGIMADQLVMVNKLADDFDGVYPATQEPYTTEEWRDEMYITIERVKTAIGSDKLLIGNSVTNGYRYFEENAARFLSVLDGVVAEGFKGPISWDSATYAEEKYWVENIRMLTSIQTKRKYIVATAKYDKYLINSATELDQHILFTFATFMLGKGDYSGFSYMVYDKIDGIERTEHPYLDIFSIEIGGPEADYYEDNGVYQRNFENGRVLVNPSGQNIAVDPGPGFTTVDGTPVEQIDMNAHTGLMLLKSP